MNLIDEVARLKELEAKATPVGWIKATQPEYDADYETADHLVGGPTGRDEYDQDEGIIRADDDGWGQVVCRPDLERDADFIADMRNAAPDLLAVLSGFQEGDMQILDLFVAFMEHFKPEGHLNDAGPGANITNAEAAACLRRYRDMAQAMEGKR